MDVLDWTFDLNIRRLKKALRKCKFSYFSVVHLTSLCVPHLEKTKGCVVNVSSVVRMRPVTKWTICVLLFLLKGCYARILLHDKGGARSVHALLGLRARRAWHWREFGEVSVKVSISLRELPFPYSPGATDTPIVYRDASKEEAETMVRLAVE